MAVLLIDGTLSFEAAHDHDRMQDPEVLALRRRITLVPSQELAHAIPRRQAIVAVKARDGRRVSRRTVAVRGTADNPMTLAEVEAKASALIGSVFAARRTEAIVHAMRNIEAVPDITTLRRLWQPSTGKHAAQGPIG